jgi:glycerol kinase
MTGAILALDQGTSASKALVVRADGTVAATGEAPLGSRTAGADGVEQEPEEIWDSLVTAARRALAATAERPAAVALANQGETVLAWERATGKPLSPAISWQDRRAGTVCSRLAAHAGEVREVTGLQLDPYFSAPKMSWLRENVTASGVVTTTDTWLLHRLTGEFVTDAATASRTLLLDLATASWSPRMCELFAVDAAGLPRIAGNDTVAGLTGAFGGELPVAGIAVDQQAALLAEGCLSPGQAKCTYGTGAFLLANTGGQAVASSAGLVSCVAWSIAGKVTYCLDGQVYTAGSAVSWLRRTGILDDPSSLDRMAASPAPGREVFVPALAGLGAPFWSPGARASLTGISLDTSRGVIVRAVLEGIAANVAVLAGAAARDLGQPIRRLRADGGLTRSQVLMQAQADLLQVPVDVYRIPDATALGVAALARLALGHAADAGTAVENWRPATTYEPRCSPDEAAARLQRWRRAAEAAAAPEPQP